MDTRQLQTELVRLGRSVASASLKRKFDEWHLNADICCVTTVAHGRLL